MKSESGPRSRAGSIRPRPLDRPRRSAEALGGARPLRVSSWSPWSPGFARRVFAGLPPSGGLEFRPQRLQGRELRHWWHPFAPRRRGQTRKLLPGDKKVSQAEASGMLNFSNRIGVRTFFLRRRRLLVRRLPGRLRRIFDGRVDRRSAAFPGAPSPEVYRLAAFSRFSTTRQSTFARNASMYSSRLVP